MADGILLSKDLFFASKVTGTANELGSKVDVAPSTGGALQKVADGGCRCLLVDLETPGLDVADLAQRLPDEGRPYTVGFGSHVKTALLESAREAGFDEVLPRSRFTSTLPELLQRCLGASGAEGA